MKTPNRHPVPPQIRNKMLQIEFDEKDMDIFYEIEQDEDSVSAWLQIIQKAPPEKKILIHQIMNIIKEVTSYEYS